MSADPQLAGIGPDLFHVTALADEYHPKAVSGGFVLGKGFQNDPQSLVPADSSDKQVDGGIFWQIEALTGGGDCRMGNPAPGKIHTVWHDNIVTLVAQTFQIFSGAPADGPDLVTGTDIIHQRPLASDLQSAGMDHIGNINIKLCVIGHDERRVHNAPQLPGKDRGGDRTMAVEYGNLLPFQLPGNVGRKGNPSHVPAGFVPEVNAGVADHGVGKQAVLCLRMIRCDDNGGKAGFGQSIGIVHDRVYDPVNQGRKRVIEKTHCG